MKTTSFLILLAICFSITSFGQGLDFGIKAGTDIHKINGKSFDEEFKFGYHIGAFAEIKLRKIGIQPEIYFSQVNAKTASGLSSIGFANNNPTKIKFSYLNIPVLLNLRLNSNIAFQLGPQFGILTDENSSLLTNGKNAFKKGDFSMTGGLQLKFLKLRLYGRYVIGLNNFDDIDNGEKWKKQTVHLGVGYAIL